MVFLLVLLQIVNFNPPFGQMIAQHDTGNVIMRVTARGCIGDTATPASGTIINGFKYPKTGGNWLFFGGFAIGNSINYVADGYYAPHGLVSRDFKVVDSLNRVFFHGAQEWECVYNDSGDPTPQNIRITQYSIGSPNPLYDDGVIMQFTAANTGAAPVNNLYAGLIFDFDMAANLCRCGSDTIRRCVWMRQNTTAYPTIGVKILSPQSWANLACIDNIPYVYPDTGLADSFKFKFLSGDIRAYSSIHDTDYSVLASVGPFNLNPGDEYNCAFAVFGGDSLPPFLANADSLQSYYNQIQGISENSLPKVNLPMLKLSSSNPVKNNSLVKLQVSEKGKVVLNLYDALGRYLNTLWQGSGPCDENIRFNTKNLSAGLYFLQLSTKNESKTLKVIISK
jgi:Secretion system C-terminal sorting domain